jgi:hypothetical protein
MTLKKSVAVLSVVAVAAIAAPTAALAHECYNANRSEQGNAGASNSQRWLTIETAEFFASAHEFLPVAQLSPAQIAQASAMAEAQGIPSTFTIFIGAKTIGEAAAAYEKNGKSADGKGIDHLFDAYGNQLVAIVFAVAGA